jgi:hypothetical protein
VVIGVATGSGSGEHAANAIRVRPAAVNVRSRTRRWPYSGAMSPGDWAWLAIMLVGCAGMIVLARRIEPHRSSRDGSAFNCFIQPLDGDGRPSGRWREGRAEVVDDRVRIRPRLFLRFTPHADTHRVIARSDEERRGKAVFVLTGDHDGASYLSLRLPARSPAAQRLDGLVSPQ